LQRRRLSLDGDTALFFYIHRVQHLRAHLSVAQTTTTLNNAIGQRGLAVINVRNDGEISNVFHQQKGDLQVPMHLYEMNEKRAHRGDAP
jgi:hypothetical protein